MQPLSKTNMSCTPAEIFQNLRKGPRLEKTDILCFKSSEILPFRFYSFPEFNEKMKKIRSKVSHKDIPQKCGGNITAERGAGGPRETMGRPFPLAFNFNEAQHFVGACGTALNRVNNQKLNTKNSAKRKLDLKS